MPASKNKLQEHEIQEVFSYIRYIDGGYRSTRFLVKYFAMCFCLKPTELMAQIKTFKSRVA